MMTVLTYSHQKADGMNKYLIWVPVCVSVSLAQKISFHQYTWNNEANINLTISIIL